MDFEMFTNYNEFKLNLEKANSLQSKLNLFCVYYEKVHLNFLSKNKLSDSEIRKVKDYFRLNKLRDLIDSQKDEINKLKSENEQ
jgi:hypothetical protein